MDENEPTQVPTNSKKQDADPASLPQLPPAQMPQPTIVPFMLRMHLTLAPATPAKSSKDQAEESEDPPVSTSSINTLAATTIQIPIPPDVSVPASLNQPPQNIKPTAQTSAPSPRVDILAEEAAPTRLTVEESDKPTAKANFDLAFTAKITPLPSTIQTPPETSVQAVPQTQTAPPTAKSAAAAPNQPDNTQVAATNQNQQSDQNGDGNFPRETKQPEKGSAKAAPASVTQDQQQPQISSSVAPVPYAEQVMAPVKTNTNIGQADTPSDRVQTSQPIDARPTTADLPAKSNSTNSDPVRDLSLRLGSTPGNQVEVKIQERAGEVHVAVLSSSPSLSTDLKQQVGDLIGKLDKAGYHAEALRQAVSSTAAQSSNQPGAGQQDFSGRQQQERQQGQGRQKRNTQPQWLQEMNTTLGPGAAEGVNKQ